MNTMKNPTSAPDRNGAGGGAGGVKPLRILVAFECSGAIRRELRKLGHNAWSCDVKPARDGDRHHHQCDVREVLAMTFDDFGTWDAVLAIGPDCTYLTISAEWAYKEPDFARYPGVGYHQRLKPGTLTGAARQHARDNAVKMVRAVWNCGIPKIAIENPVGVLSTRFMKPTQIIQPHQFGEDASKATCLWLKGLPPLVPTQHVAPRMVNGKPRWANQTDGGQNKLSPGEGRAELRAATYPGVARAMAIQWFGGRRGQVPAHDAELLPLQNDAKIPSQSLRNPQPAREL